MNDDRQARILAALRELFDAIAEEVRSNPSFAGKVQASLANAAGMMNPPRNLPVPVAAPPAVAPAAKDSSKANKLLHNITFDPLECHIEAALLGGREQEARVFLSKLDRWQLEEVVKAQRLPGTKNLQKAIFEGDSASAVEAIVGSAFERIRGRLSTAR
jgi:hypothetical protein